MQTIEKELREEIRRITSERDRWRFALESARDGVWDWNLETDEVFLSDPWKEMLGYSPDEISDNYEEWHSRVHPDDLEKVISELQDCIVGNTDFFENEHRLKCKDGSYRWILDRGKIIAWNKTGKPVRFIGTHIDIHERKLLELQLAESHRDSEHMKDLLNYIIEHSNGGIAVHDCNLNYIYVSDQYLKMYKIDDPNIIGKHHYEVFPDLPQKWRDVHQRVLKGEALSADRDPYEKADGTVEWTRWECRPWYTSDGTIGGLIVYTEVITEFVQAEKNALENQAKYQSLFNNMALASCVHELVLENGEAVNYRIIDINSEYTKILGLTRDDVIGKLATEVYQVDQAPFIDIYSQVAQTGHPATFETYYKPIRRHLTITASCPKPGFFATVFNDITEGKELQMELTRLKEQLEEEVAEKTVELQTRIQELERFHEATIEREFRIKELRDEIQQLKKSE